jgi:hypothetical protein
MLQQTTRLIKIQSSSNTGKQVAIGNQLPPSPFFQEPHRRILSEKKYGGLDRKLVN